MILVVAKYLVRKGFNGFTVFPFVFVAKKECSHDLVLINHEKVHLKQQAEMLVLPFFVWYLAEYVVRLLQYGNMNKAYRNICFEREAYANEKDPDFLRQRPVWNFLKYL